MEVEFPPLSPCLAILPSRNFFVSCPQRSAAERQTSSSLVAMTLRSMGQLIKDMATGRSEFWTSGAGQKENGRFASIWEMLCFRDIQETGEGVMTSHAFM